EPLIAWARGPVGTAGKWTLRWNGEAFDFKMRDDRQGTAFALETRPAKPLVLQGANGFTRKGREPGAGSLYYSFTRLETRGELSIAGKTWRVHGESWMDREFSSSRLGEQQAGWDWFSIQLLDGQEYMLYLLRRRDGTVDFRHATRVLPDGSPSYLPPGLWSVRSTENWTSPATGAVYPSRWIIRVLGSPSMELTPVIPAQENRSRLTGGLHYWEGAVTVRDMEGAFLGRGYVELTGYGKESRPPV
ncbi:MAG: lipocalin family protein, partial [Acidobacteriota bacterium]